MKKLTFWTLLLAGCLAGSPFAAAPPQSAPATHDDPANHSRYRILFTRQQNNQDDLYTMAVDGSGLDRLTDHRSKDSHGVATLDGEKIVFTSERKGLVEDLDDDREREAIRQVTDPPRDADYSPDWSPDGTRIVFASGRDGNGEIYVAAADGTGPRNLTNHEAADNFPVWSPDGRQLAFASDREGKWGIFVMAPDGGAVTRVDRCDGNAIEPAWFADSGRLAFQCDAAGSFDLYSVRLGDGETEQLTSGPADDKRPRVSPDDRWIVFESTRGKGTQIHIMPASGGEPTRLTDEAYNFAPAWLPLK